MDSIFLTIVNMSITGSIVILAVFVIRLLLKRAPKVFSYLLWLVVLFRLVCPFALSTGFGMPQAMVSSQSIFMQNGFQNGQTTESADGSERSTNSGQTNQQTQKKNEPVSNADEKSTGNNRAENSSIWHSVISGAAYVWVAGLVLLLLYSLISYGRLRKKLAGACFRSDNIYELEKLPTPFVLGFLNPCIYLPAGLFGEEREYILAHERMHIRRLDYLVKLLGFLVVILHWMNPLVWAAFIYMTKDMEMSCDEAVIRNFGMEMKKEYSMSLLHMAMPQKGLHMAPLAFGEGNVKGRIQNVLKYKKTGVGILMICVSILLAAAVILTTNRTIPKNQMRLGRVFGTEVDTSSILQEHKFNEDVKSYLLFSVSVADGQELERNVIASGNITEENRKGDLNISFQYMNEEDHRVTITATDNASSQFMTYFLDDYTMRAGNVRWDGEKTYHDMAMDTPYLLTTEYVGSEKTTGIQAFECEALANDEVAWNAAMEQSQDSGISMFLVYYVIFDKNIEDVSMDLEGFSLHTAAEKAADEAIWSSTVPGLSKIKSQAEKFAQAFCDRDGEVIASMISEEVKAQLQESGLLEMAGGTASFGMSSPWPMEPENAYQISNINIEDNSAEILYYAVTSDPHVTVWQEKISFASQEEKSVIVSEELHYLDNISTAEEYRTAYPQEIIDETNMDYEYNGMGRFLNDNALGSYMLSYKDLFQPDTAAIQLLNLDPKEVKANWGFMDDGTEDAFVTLAFGETEESITVRMVQPYGSGGIWIPRNQSIAQDTDETDGDAATEADQESINVVDQFMAIPWDEIEAKNLKFTGQILYDQQGIQCIGEIPEHQIRLFGYGDAEIAGRGVAIQIGDDVNYFDWYYTSPQGIPPSVYWDDSKKQLQVALRIYTGTGAAADELHILQQYETGTLADHVFSLEEYSALLQEKMDFEYDTEEKKLRLVNPKKHTVLGELEDFEAPDGISSLELGMISRFILGDEIILQVHPGYVPNGQEIAEYGDLPTFNFPVFSEYEEDETLKMSLGNPEGVQ